MDTSTLTGVVTMGVGCALVVAPPVNSIFAVVQLWGLFGWRFWAFWWAACLSIMACGSGMVYTAGLLLGGW